MIKKGGFTLIEVIIYIALFSLLMGTAFVTAYQLIEGSNKLSVKNTTEEEGNFVMRKINWVLTGIDSAYNPIIGGSGCSQTLFVYKTDSAVNPTELRLNKVSGVNYIEIKEGSSGTFLPITTVNASTTCLKFSSISGLPRGIIATSTIGGIDFVITKYIRR